jgi:hypothetical protein
MQSDNSWHQRARWREVRGIKDKQSGRSYASKGTSLDCLIDTARLGSDVIFWVEQWRSLENVSAVLHAASRPT